MPHGQQAGDGLDHSAAGAQVAEGALGGHDGQRCRAGGKDGVDGLGPVGPPDIARLATAGTQAVAQRALGGREMRVRFGRMDGPLLQGGPRRLFSPLGAFWQTVSSCDRNLESSADMGRQS